MRFGYPQALKNAGLFSNAKPHFAVTQQLQMTLHLSRQLAQTTSVPKNSEHSKKTTRSMHPLAAVGLALFGYYLYSKTRDWYFGWTIEFGDAPPDHQKKFVETEAHTETQKKLQEDYLTHTNRVVLVGESGVGKSATLARSYHKTQAWFEYPTYLQTFNYYFRYYLMGSKTPPKPWLKASLSASHENDALTEEALLKKQMLALAEKVHNNTWANIDKISLRQTFFRMILDQLPDRVSNHFMLELSESEQTTLYRLKHYLETHPGWLITLDNIQHLKAIEPYLPNRGGTVLLTTNNKDLATFSTNGPTRFERFTPEESRQLIQMHLVPQPKISDDTQINRLIIEFNGLPLGLIQACAYISNNGFDVRTYLSRLEETPLTVLANDPELLRHPNLVKTMQLTLARYEESALQRVSWPKRWLYYVTGAPLSREAHLLYLMSLMAPIEIPEAILRNAFNSSAPVDEIYEDACGQLTQYHVIEREEQVYLRLHSLNHRILQAMARKHVLEPPRRLSLDNVRYYFKQNSRSLLNGLLEALLDENIDSKLGTHPLKHALYVEQSLQHALYVEQFLLRASYKQYSKALASRFLLLTHDIESFLRHFDKIAIIHFLSGASDEPISEKLLDIRCRRLEMLLNIGLLTADEKSVVLNDLAFAYGNLGDVSKKQNLLEEALSILEQHYGCTHWQTAMVVSYLANVYGTLGDITKKNDFLKKLLAIQKQYYDRGSLDNEREIGLINLADAYHVLGDTLTQTTLLEEVLEIQTRLHGRTDSKTLSTISCLADAYEDLGEFTAQKDLLEEALEIDTQLYGRIHFQTSSTMICLAYSYEALGNFTTQKDLLEEALEIETQLRDRAGASTSLVHLANAYGNLGKFTTQKDLLEEALEIETQRWGRDDWMIVHTLMSLASAYGNLGKFTTQKNLLKEALEIETQYYALDDQPTAMTLTNLADIYEALGEFTAQKDLLEEALSMKEQQYGRAHWQTAITLTNLANTYGNLGDTSKQKDLLREAHTIFNSQLGMNNSRTKKTEALLKSMSSKDHQKVYSILEKNIGLFRRAQLNNARSQGVAVGDLSLRQKSRGF